MPSIDKVLCTIDFSEYAMSALNYAIGISQTFNARMVVYHSIYSPRDPIYGTTDFKRGSDLEKKRSDIRKAIDALMVNCPVPWEASLSIGDPVVESVRICRDLGIDLVVAASHGISGFKRIFLGTVVERMARQLNKPMLVVRHNKNQSRVGLEKPFAGFNRVIAGCDFNEDSIPSIQQAVDFAKIFRAPLHLVHVMETPINEEMVDLTEAPYGEVQEKLAKKMKARLQEILPALNKAGLEVFTDVTTGIPAEEIVRCAKELKADLLVVGVRYHPSFDKIVIGPSTELVLRNAPCAVLTVPGIATQ